MKNFCDKFLKDNRKNSKLTNKFLMFDEELV